jgi:vitamin B12 transporter
VSSHSLSIAVVVMLALQGGAASMVRAQESGTIEGRVTREIDGDALPGVRVSVRGAPAVFTTADGTYTLAGVPAGSHEVEFMLDGFLTRRVPTVEVQAGATARADAVLTLGFASETTVTARRDETNLQDVSQNVEVMTLEEIEETPAVNILGALNTIIGVDVDTGSGNTRTGTFMYIDGYSDVYIRKMVDGIDVSQVVSNWSLLNAYPEEMVQQVDVMKGGSSANWGSNMGGIVNLVTSRPMDLERPNFTLRGFYSDFDNDDLENAEAFPNSGDLYSFSANVQDTVGEDSYYMVGYSRNENDGFVEQATENNHSEFVKLGHNLTESQLIDVLYNYNKIGSEGLNFHFNPPGARLPYAWNYFQATDGVSQVGSARYFNQMGPTFGLEGQFKYHDMDYDSHSDYFAGATGNLGPAGTSAETSFEDRKVGGTFKTTWAPEGRFSLVSGIDYYRIKADFSDFIANQPVITVDSTAPFTSLAIELGRVGVDVGARYDDDSSFGSQLSPQAGVHVRLMEATILRANAARTFRVPPLWYTLGASYFNIVLPNPDLGPERAWAYSAGFESQELKHFYTKLSWYYHDMEDGIVSVFNPANFTFSWANTGEFTRKGYEAEGGAIIPGGLTAYFAYNHNDHSNDVSQVVVYDIPTTVKKGGLKYQNEKIDFLANLRARWVYWNTNPTTTLLPNDQEWLLDLRLLKGFPLRNDLLEVYVDVFNLTDELYWSRPDFPNPRRWWGLGLNYRFR